MRGAGCGVPGAGCGVQGAGCACVSGFAWPRAWVSVGGGTEGVRCVSLSNDMGKSIKSRESASGER